jgi:hypothetical protein
MPLAPAEPVLPVGGGSPLEIDAKALAGKDHVGQSAGGRRVSCAMLGVCVFLGCLLTIAGLHNPLLQIVYELPIFEGSPPQTNDWHLKDPKVSDEPAPPLRGGSLTMAQSCDQPPSEWKEAELAEQHSSLWGPLVESVAYDLGSYDGCAASAEIVWFLVPGHFRTFAAHQVRERHELVPG